MPAQLRSLFPALALLALSTLNSQLSTASAQGTAFSYSGQLQVGGVPVTGLYDFQFSLSNAPSGGGSQVGNALVVSALGVTNGLFSTTMDFGPVFSNSPTWLAIGVRPAGSLTFTNLTPLQQILPTPYAVYAETAGYATVLANGVALGTGQGNAIDPSAGNSFIGGGFGNNIGAGSTTVTVGGGTLNYATGQYVTVGGGQANRATNDEATVGGGSSNNAGGPGTTVAGGQDNYASGQFAAVGGGYQNNASGFMAAISGGQGNQATDQYTTIGGGDANTASVEYGTVGGGVDNTALGYGTVGGGQGNIAGAYNATAGGGENNLASGYAAVVSGGEQNSASGPHAVVGGGNANFATNVFATVPGGLDNVAGGPYSFAAGYTAQATNDGAFVWSDDEGGLPFTSTNNNSFNVRASGGVRFVTGGAGMTLDGAPVLTGAQPTTTFSGQVVASSFLIDASGDFVAGLENLANGGKASVTGGVNNNASGAGDFIGGGGFDGVLTSGNTILDAAATIGGGLGNLIASGGKYSFIGGGSGNSDSAPGAVITGGIDNQINGTPSQASGGGAPMASNISGGTGNIINIPTSGAAMSNPPGSDIGGGNGNMINGLGSAIAGGSANTANGAGDFIGGGGYDGVNTEGNTIQDNAGTIGGGLGNEILTGGSNGFIGGGYENTVSGVVGVVGGGSLNNVSGNDAVVGGGYANTNSGIAATVSGGFGNVASGHFATVPGGQLNQATGNTSFAAGNQARAAYDNSFVWSDGTGPTASSNIDQFMVRASGGIFFFSSAAATAAHLTITGSISGGDTLFFGINGESLTFGLGNYINPPFASCGVSEGDSFSSLAANLSSAINQSFNSMGISATASGNVITLQSETSWFNLNLAAASATAGSDANVTVSGSENLTLSDVNYPTGTVLDAGSGSWSTLSDRKAKENFEAVSVQAVLEEVAALPVSTWNYKTQAKSIRHIGPVAQDFHAAFGVGENDTTISVVDEGGVALAAIQGLNQKVDAKDAEIEALKQQNGSLVERLQKLETLVQSIAQQK